MSRSACAGRVEAAGTGARQPLAGLQGGDRDAHGARVVAERKAVAHAAETLDEIEKSGTRIRPSGTE